MSICNVFHVSGIIRNAVERNRYICRAQSISEVINKNAILRFEVINECLSSRKGYTITELVDACNERYRNTPGLENITVKSRQVLYDMEDMHTIYGIDIVSERDQKDHRKVRFSYPDGARDIHGEKMLDADYGDFNQAIWLLESLVGLPYVQKAAETLKRKIKAENGSAPVFSVESNKLLTGFDQLSSFFNYIRHKQPLKITYMARFEEERIFLFQPYYLKQYNGRWFLFGWNYDFCHKDGRQGIIQNLAIDRIKDKRVDKSRFSAAFPPRENDIDFEHYFDDIIGVTHIPGAKVEHIIIKVHDRSDWNRLVSKPIHPSMKTSSEEMSITLDIKPNPEFYATLSQFEHIEILSPASVRDAYINRINTILAQYK